MSFRLRASFVLLVLAAIGLLGLIHADTKRRLAEARADFIGHAQGDTRLSIRGIDATLNHIYENLRTLAALPSVRNVDRHGTNLVGDSRETFQQIYNNLAASVAVSEVYVLPASFNPERLDPVTGKLEEPIVMFDELIVDAAARAKEMTGANLPGAAHDEIEIHEYREFARQIAWLKQNYPTRAGIPDMRVPIIGSPSLITCDNSYFVYTGNDADRMGVLFSVPFYGPDGAFKGVVAAIVLERALQAALPARNARLFHRAYEVGVESDMSDLAGSERARAEGRPDPSLVYSEVVPLSLNDPRGRWEIWVGRSNRDFEASAHALSAKSGRASAIIAVACLFLVGLVVCWLIAREANAAADRQKNLERKVAERAAEIERLALHDPLTGLGNRSLMQRQLGQLLTPGKRSNFALICVDLDRFKVVNDSFGHAAGDQYLIAVAERMRASIDPRALLARWGGDEFVIAVPGVLDEAQAGAIAARLIETIRAPLQLAGHEFLPGCSAGIALAGPEIEDADCLMRNADLALYRAKSEGRGSFRVFDAEIEHSVQFKRLLEVDMRAALASQQFFVAYQPIMCAATQRLEGFEALLRWRHPERGLISPLDFIPLAEETGLIGEIGEFVLREACREAAGWPNHLKVAINLSPLQVQKVTLPLTLAKILGETGLWPHRLELEVTESVLLHDKAENRQTLNNLRAIGARVSLDDFGTGYSSLSYLRSFPFDRIKIDQSFVFTLESRSESLAIVKAVTQLAASLGMMTTAEGVETDAQLETLIGCGCHSVQGYLFGKPMTAEAASSFIARQMEASAVPLRKAG